MSNIIFKELKFENFGPFYGEHQFEFHKNGIHKIVGENLDYEKKIGEEEEDLLLGNSGSGKSFFIKSVGYALFGKVPNNEKLNHEQLICKKTKRNMMVSIEFEDEEHNKEYKVERYRKYSSPYGNKTILYFKIKDEWKDISQADTKMVQQQIDSIFLMSYTTFMKTTLLARDGDQNFLEMKSYYRGQVIENIVRSNKFNEYVLKIKEKLRDIRKEIDNINDKVIHHESSLLSLKKVVIDSIARMKNAKKEIDFEINKIKNEINDIQATDNNYEKNVKEYMNYLKTSARLSKDCRIVENDINKIDKILQSSYDKANTYRKDILKRKKQLQEYLNEGGIICEQCGKIANKSHYEKEKKLIIKRIKYERKLLEKLFPIIRNEIKLYRSTYKIYKNITEQYLDVKTNQPTALTNEIKKDILHEIKAGNKTFSKLDDVDNLKKQLISLEERREYVINVDEANETRKKMWSHKQNLNIEKDNLKKLKEKYKMAEWWDEALDFRNENSLKQFIFLKIIPVFNTILNEIVSLIFDNQFKIIFDSSFDESIIYNKEEYSYFELSTGEKAKLNFAINLAILNLMKINLKTTNVLFLDEVFTGMDEKTINTFLEILQNSYSSSSSIYIVSHSKADIPSLTTMKIRKKNSISILIKD